jgi:hypothetical protein
MAIKMKVGALDAARQALAALPRLPMKPAYRLGRIADAIEAERAQYIKLKRALFVELGEEREGQLIILAANNAEYSRRHDELLDVEVTLEHEPVPLEQICFGPDGKTPTEVQPEVLARLGGIIVDSQE